MKLQLLIAQAVLVLFPLSVFTEDMHLKHIKVGNKVFIVDERDTLQIEKKLNKHNLIIDAVDSVSFIDFGKHNKFQQRAIPDSLKVSLDVNNYSTIQKLKYTAKKTFGSVEYEFWDDDTIHSLHYIYNNRDIPKRELLETLRAKKADLSEYPIIPESTAIQRAITLLNTIIGVENAKMYDSMRVNVDAKGYMNMSYLIQFEIKVKNDIKNAGYVCIIINAYDGTFDSYSGSNPELCKQDYEYTPKISKQTALEMYLGECSKSNINIKISQAFLHKHYLRNPPRWHWQIYGFDKDKPGTIAKSMFIDSETGEVFINDIK